ncbi:MAG: glycosyltransferase family 2 protein [Casimicrobiaceae bacterium]
MRLALVIPAYNEARTIHAIVQQALLQTAIVIVVDDGSTDGTGEALAGLPVVLVTHAENQGKAAALWDGFRAALEYDPDFVATLDGDGQHLPADVERLVRVAAANAGSIVIGARLNNRHNAPLARRFANRFADFWISWAAGYPIADSQSGQRVYPASLLRDVQVRHDPGAAFTLESEILIRASRLGYQSVAVPISTTYLPDARASHFRPVRDIGRIVVMVARSLLSQGMHLTGLWNALARTPSIVRPGETAAPMASGCEHV